MADTPPAPSRRAYAPHGPEPLRRKLGLHHFVAIGINICIGGSIFLIGADAFRLAGPWSLVVAVAVGTFALIMGLVFAEVSSRFDGTGGPYLYARSAFGPFVGLQVAWMMWYTRVLAQASLTNGVIDSLGYFGGLTVTGWMRQLLILALVAITAVIHLRGIEDGARTILGFSAVKLIPLFIVIATGAAAGHLTPDALPSPPSLTSLMACALLLLFSFSGYEVIPVTAGEGRNPQRDAPLATLVSIVVMVTTWLCLQLILISAVPDLGQEGRPVASAARIIAGEWAGAVVNIGAIISAFGTCLGTLLTASRCLYAAAADQLVPSWFSAVSARAVPHHSIVFSTIVVAALALSGSFAFLAAAAALPRLIVFFVVAAALLRQRHLEDTHHASPPARFRAPFGGWLAGTAMLVCVAGFVAVSTSQLTLGVAGIALGAVLYLSARRSHSRS